MTLKEQLGNKLKNNDVAGALAMFTTKSKKALECLKQYEPGQHDKIVNRRDKIITTTTYNEKGEQTEKSRVVNLNKLPIPYQKKIVQASVAFLFGAPIDYKLNQTEDENKNTIFENFKSHVKELRLNTLNRDTARLVFSETETARLYVPYQKEGQIKLKCVNLANSLGDTLYTLFDENQTMIAFARSYIAIGEDRKEQNKIDIYTDDAIYFCENLGSSYVVKYNPNLLKKIPVLYFSQENPDWSDVQPLIERLEWLTSTRADTNDYSADPILVLTGDVASLPEKEEVGKVVQLEQGASAQYLTPQMAVEMVKDERDNLKQLINYCTNTPDLSMDNMRASIGQMSGKAIQLMFFDATLKSMNNQELFGEMLDREINIIKSFMKLLNSTNSSLIDDLDINIKFNSPLPDDIDSYLNLLSTATAGKAVLSQETAIKLNPMVTDAGKELEQIKAENESEQLQIP